ncbi:fungal-specific transcription factor domain-containing protein [Leptodontidium sp. MPI-SDFR-AT-0119]|nr:fungal-specific transcription factor domain-containing protein [Leptodontidium sp. MPI-SDFR-AT-0119]
MDGSPYHPGNGMSNSNSPYLPNIAPHQLQQTNIHHTTLPPLQATQHATMPSHLQYPGSAPHTPRTPATPGTPVSGNNMGNFPQMTGQHQQQQQQQQQRYQQMMPTSTYQQAPQVYRTAGSMMPQSSMSMSHPQPIAPAPLQNRGNQPLRPMPPHGLQHMQGGMQGYGQNNMGMMQDMEPPTHVVGSQGRRGILPSAPGRPAVSATGTGKNALIPAKDADGKFPCPHCTKTYLHAKHLKRHLLRHTGDRPYMCVLCRDTFSRSDILKRHFQKCSIRRGNPTGASHLSHAQAHLKKSHPGPHKSANPMSNDNELMGVNGMNGGSLGPNLFGISPDGTVPDAGSNMTDEQSEQLRARAAVIGGGRDGNRMTGPSPGGSNRASFEQQNYAGPVASMPSGMNPSVAFNLSQGQNGHSYNQGYDYASHGNSNTMQQPQPQPPAGQDWSHMFHQQPPQPGYMPYNSTVTNPQAPIKTEFKTEPSISNSNSGLYTAIYPGVHPNGSTNIPSWNLQNDPLEDISSRLIFFCFPQNQIIGRANDIRKYLSAPNIKHFLELFTSFQGHFPVMHMPSFRIADAFDGLLLAMICIGAVYSDRLSASQARDMMELSKSAIERNSQVFSVVSREQTGDSGFGGETIGSSKSEMEQITAMFMMQIMSCWHGTPIQREKARREFPMIVDIARRAGLTKPMTISPFSVLHQPNVTVENFSAASFDWSAWVEQEKRSRLMFAIYLLDCAMVIFFNASPMFERDEIRLPLPADDAAWDAASSSECAEALGLHGPAAARTKNSEGSRRPKQPELPVAMKTLMHGDWLQPGTTNLYSKFILVHTLHIQLWGAQKQLSAQENGSLAFPTSGATTPVSQDWRNDATGSGQRSANTSGRGTPVDSAGQLASSIKAINNAFDKWKKAWDEDMTAQYPPSSSNYRRFGFCRDAVHFYWLAKYLLQSGRSLDSQMAPDQRFGQVMNLLKSVKTWVQTDSAKRGEELGSVNDIDKDYGVLDLTLDMAQLFKPINQQIDSPVPGVQTNMGNTMG